ncbi:hypothetical protein Poli38472_004969 [Pythium oligandrum]|uniref:Uncharacterized protein n=1 Tax=Pythium oligandrum TaxID=41045 RepID=A0A8K1CBR9_PYTOL|nr:hypothetical protein Poli38472_004969 [Pythium oligandrum]|eukprot:TMW59900.1 hypothetical protein Poli38472_004969 [Pythium oligandrum]
MHRLGLAVGAAHLNSRDPESEATAVSKDMPRNFSAQYSHGTSSGSPDDLPFVLNDQHLTPGYGVENDVDLVTFYPKGYNETSTVLGGMVTGNPERVLGTLSVVAVTFFFGCGGPLGSEDAISTAGPLVALMAYIVYPIVFTFPYGAVVAELCTTFPEDGGFPIAVRNAFGQFWGFQVGYWSWVGNIVSTAIYPAMLLDLLVTHAGLNLPSAGVEYLVKATLALVFSIPLFFKTQLLTRMASFFLFVVLLSTLVYVVWAYAHSGSYEQLGQVRREGTKYNEDLSKMENIGDADVDWFALLDTVFWNYDGIQMASVFGGQVLIPARVYPRAISITVGLTVLCYVMPIIPTVAAKYLDWTLFGEITYANTAFMIGGTFLRTVMVIVNFITTIGMYMSSLFCESTELAGMAAAGIVHHGLGVRSQRYGSPHVSVALTVIFTLILVALDTSFLLPVTNVFASLVVAAIFITGVQLRRRFPFFRRPTTVPGGAMTLIAISVLPIAISGTLLVKALINSVITALTVVGFLVVGVCYGFWDQWHRRQNPRPTMMH